MANAADDAVDKMITGLTGYTRNSELLYNLRRLIGMKNGGEIAIIPDIDPRSTHRRSEGAPGNYYINFQDPAGQPTDPVVFNGKTYTEDRQTITTPLPVTAGIARPMCPGRFLHHYDQWFEAEPERSSSGAASSTTRARSRLEFDLPNGTYNVTVGVGYRGGTRQHTHRHRRDDIHQQRDDEQQRHHPHQNGDGQRQETHVGDGHVRSDRAHQFSRHRSRLRATRSSHRSARDQRAHRHEHADCDFALDIVELGHHHDAALLEQPITDLNWNSALTLTSSAIGNSYTATMPYSGDVRYFALKSQAATGAWSGLSNNAFWPCTGRLPAADPEVRMIHRTQNRILRLPSGRAF